MKWDVAKYFDPDFWTHFFTGPKKFSYYIIKCTRIVLASIRGFQADECALKASALTFYSLLSIVPVFAVAFGIAKGFGFQEMLESELSQKFVEQKEVVSKLIDFSYKALQNTQSGLIAGVGLIVLFWTVLKLLSNIESSFNSIWKVKKPRSFARSFSDYLAMMLFCPIFFFASSSLSVYVLTQITDLSKARGIWETISPFMYLTLHLFPLVLTWLLFTALYSIMPNTRVPLKYAFIAGVFAGTAYQIVQSIYIHFQIGLASYGAIYGSFAALPLFLIWLNTSWWIALGGAEIAYHSENDPINFPLAQIQNRREADARVLGLLIIQQCTRAFSSGKAPPSVYELSQHIGAPVVSIKKIIQQLIDAGLLTEVNWHGNSGEYYQPGRDTNTITLKSVCDALNTSRHEFYLMVYDDDVKHYEEALKAADNFVEDSRDNPTIEQLVQHGR
jgi:membrane protein